MSPYPSGVSSSGNYPSGYPPSNPSNPYSSGGGSSYGSSYSSAPSNPFSLPPSNNPYSAPMNQPNPPYKSSGSFSQLPIQQPMQQQQPLGPNTPVGPYGAPLAHVQAAGAHSPQTGRPENLGVSPMQQMLLKEHEEELARQEARKKSESEAAAKSAAKEALQRRETAEAQNSAFLYQIEMDRIEREAESARKQLEEQQKAALSAEEQRRKQILEQMARENAELEAKKRAEQRRRADEDEAKLRAEQEKLDQRQAALAAKERQLATAAERARQEDLDAQRARDEEMARQAEETEKQQQSFYSSILDLTKNLATTNQRIIKIITLSYDDLVSTTPNPDPDSDPKVFLHDLLGHFEKTASRLVGMIHDNVMNVEDQIHSSMSSSVQGLENAISSFVIMCKRLVSAESDPEMSSWGAEERQSNAKNRSATVSYAIKTVVEILAKMKIEEAASSDGSTTKVLSATSREEAANNVERQMQAQTGERNRIAVQLGISSKRPVLLSDNFDPSSVDLASYDLAKVTRLQRLIHHWATRMHFVKLVEAMTASSQDTKVNAHRKKVLFEVLSTEASYFQSVDTVVEYFFKPFSGAAAKPNNGIITREEVSAIFGSIEQIHKFSKMLLGLFDARLQKWPSVQLFGDIFLDHADEMIIYSDYINGFDNATNVLKKCLLNPKFVAYEQECIKATGKRLDLASLLIQPVQRMPRYALLLKELISHSSSEHIDYHNLVEAKAKVSDVCAMINKKKQEYDNRVQVTQTASEVQGLPFTLNPAKSMLICQEFVQFEGPDHKHWCRGYLFSDCVVFAKCKTDRSSGSPPPYTHMESFKLVDIGVVGRKGHKKSFLLWDKTAKVSKKGERVLHFAEEIISNRWLKELKEAVETASLQAMLDADEASIALEPSRQGQLTLLCANYGDLSNPNTFIDVTSVLQKSVSAQGGKALVLPAQSKATLPGFVDPCRGKKKSLLLVYTYGGPPKTRTFMDESPVSINS